MFFFVVVFFLYCLAHDRIILCISLFFSCLCVCVCFVADHISVWVCVSSYLSISSSDSTSSPLYLNSDLNFRIYCYPCQKIWMFVRNSHNLCVSSHFSFVHFKVLRRLLILFSYWPSYRYVNLICSLKIGQTVDDHKTHHETSWLSDWKLHIKKKYSWTKARICRQYRKKLECRNEVVDVTNMVQRRNHEMHTI